MSRPSTKWLKSAAVYRHMAGQVDAMDWSDAAAAELFEFESRGTGTLKERGFLAPGPTGHPNGYAAGKHLVDVTLAMWLEDLADGLLAAHELYEQIPAEHHWWLDKVIPQKFRGDDWWMPVVQPLLGCELFLSLTPHEAAPETPGR